MGRLGTEQLAVWARCPDSLLAVGRCRRELERENIRVETTPRRVNDGRIIFRSMRNPIPGPVPPMRSPSLGRGPTCPSASPRGLTQARARAHVGEKDDLDHGLADVRVLAGRQRGEDVEPVDRSGRTGRGATGHTPRGWLAGTTLGAHGNLPWDNAGSRSRSITLAIP